MVSSNRLLFVVLTVLGAIGCSSNRDADSPKSDSRSTSNSSDEEPTSNLTQEDKNEAVRMIVAWIVEDQEIPGIGRYPDAQIMKSEKRFFVVCEFLQSDVTVSTDSRVERVTAAESKALLEKHYFQDTDYLHIEIVSESPGELQLGGANMFGNVGGHGLYFVFRKENGQLKVEGGTTWVS